MKDDVMRMIKWVWLLGVAGLSLLSAGSMRAVELTPSYLEQERLQIRYSSPVFAAQSPGAIYAAAQDQGADDSFEDGPAKRKSPFKAFALSALLPGAGQFYCGSKIKPLIFLGAEAAAWGFYFKFHGEGNDATDAYEAFSDLHWSRTDYATYLQLAYGVTDDDLVNAREVSHHLPDENTQQYYEMTGKYNQFAWGWDDAVLNSHVLDEYVVFGSIPAITGDSSTPASSNRMIYEGMRNDANNKYDRANKMIIVALLNRLVSGFEALIAARKFNERSGGANSTFTRIDVDVSLKSYRSRQDTPYMKLTYTF